MTLETALLRLVGLLDLLWLGRLGPSALATALTGQSLRWAFSGLAVGLSVGSMVLVARYLGRDDRHGASVIAWQALILCLALTAVPAALGYALADPLLRLLGTGPEVLPSALIHLRLTLLALLPFVLVVVINALLRGAGQGRLAGSILALALGLSAASEPALVFGCGPIPRLGVAGSALAPLLGFGGALAVQIAWLNRRRARLRLAGKAFGPSLTAMWQIVRAGAAGSAQLALRALAGVALIGIINRSGSRSLAAYAAANGILMAALIPSHGLSNLAAVLGIHRLRRGLPLQAWRGVWAIGACNTAYAVGLVALVFAYAPQAMAAFSTDPRVVAYGADALRIISLGYVSSSMGAILARGLDYTGHTVPTATISLLTLWGIELPAALLLRHALGLRGVWLGLAVGSVANGMLLSYRFRRGRESVQ